MYKQIIEAANSACTSTHKSRWLSILSLLVVSTVSFSTDIRGLRRSQPAQAQTVPAASSSAWGNASFPVENFQAYTSGFGYRIHPVTGQRSFHSGLDFAAPLGSYIRNWWGGKVVALSDHTACGTMITIQSGNWTHTYCHLIGHVQNDANGRKVLVDRQGGIAIWLGQTIPSGARIGRVGMTGRTTGPHLHWSLKYNGKHIDPAHVLRKMFAQKISS